MTRSERRQSLTLGLAALVAALAPAPGPQIPPPPAPVPPAAPDTPARRAQVRAEAGARTYDEAWLYYSENRIDADKVYRWSRRLREADLDAATDKPGRVAAADGHLARMRKLEAKIARIRQLGFGNSLDVLEVDYYRKEAEFWHAEARDR